LLSFGLILLTTEAYEVLYLRVEKVPSLI